MTPTFLRNLRTLMLKVSSFICVSSRARLRTFAIADQGKMPERRHRPALDEADSGRARLPGRQPLPWKLRPPAEPPRDRREGLLAELAQAAFGPDVVHQNDLAAGFQHPR